MIKIHGMSIIEVHSFPESPTEGMVVFKDDDLYIYSISSGVGEWKQLTDNNSGTSIASKTQLGNVQIGNNIYVDENGLISVDAINTVYFKDLKSIGVGGGTFSSGSWRTRILNTVVNPQPWASLNNNSFTLNVGSYIFNSITPAYRVGAHRSKLQSIVGNQVMLYGTSEYSSIASSTCQSSSHILGSFTLTAQTSFEVQHFCQTSHNSYGFGYPTNMSEYQEIYTTVKIIRIGQ